MSLKAEISMGSRLMVVSLARGVLECIRVRDMGWSSCRSRFLKSPDTLSYRGRRAGRQRALETQQSGARASVNMGKFSSQQVGNKWKYSDDLLK